MRAIAISVPVELGFSPGDVVSVFVRVRHTKTESEIRLESEVYTNKSELSRSNSERRKGGWLVLERAKILTTNVGFPEPISGKVVQMFAVHKAQIRKIQSVRSFGELYLVLVEE